jgi:hypothetical protein
MTDTITRLMEANLLEVFNERDGQRRAAAISRTYAPEIRWTDYDGVTVGHEALGAKAKSLQESIAGLVFTKAGPGRPNSAGRSIGFADQQFASLSARTFLKSPTWRAGPALTPHRGRPWPCGHHR